MTAADESAPPMCDLWGPVEIIEADLRQPSQTAAVVELIDEYAATPIGGSHGLTEEVKRRLPAELAAQPNAIVFLAIASPAIENATLESSTGASASTEASASAGASATAGASASVRPTARSPKAVGVAVCFAGYSTFAAKPLLNVHDLAVSEGWQGKGIGNRLLDAVEAKARSIGCCRVTLEVRQDNDRAVAIYHKRGYRPRGPEEFFRVKEFD